MRMAAAVTLTLAAVALAGCTQDKVTAPTLTASCGAGLAPVTLAAGAYAFFDPAASSGCIAFAANASATDSAEYLLVVMATGGVPGDSAAFTLRSATAAGITAAPPVALPAASLAPPASGTPQRAAPPAVGSLRSFVVVRIR